MGAVKPLTQRDRDRRSARRITYVTIVFGIAMTVLAIGGVILNHEHWQWPAMAVVGWWAYCHMWRSRCYWWERTMEYADRQ